MDYIFNEIFPKYKQIYNHLLKEISAGKLKSGDKMPSEKELCDMFGVSRITSKKALEMLIENRLISRQRGKGSFVKGTPAQEIRINPAAFRPIAFLISAFNDSFGNKLIYSIENTCANLGYHLILKLTHDSPAKKALQILML
jgi:DNA-binding GntR family transcriptional regulator